jgi:hypothetical protein
MKVGGFTIVRNAVRFDYPVREAILSILPLCDEFVVAIGDCDDGTEDLIRTLPQEKLRIIHSVWDDSLREGGVVLARETDKAFSALDTACDWAFYIQADEAVHEADHDRIRSAMQQHLDDAGVDGLLFRYRHFYASYDHVGASNKWYANEIRIVRNRPDIRSYRDAQGFRKADNTKLRVKPADAWVHHYGWVREPSAMQRKLEGFQRLYHDDAWMERNVYGPEAFEYERHITRLQRFNGSHPAVMTDRIARQNWTFRQDISFTRKSLKDHAKDLLKHIGIDTNYRNYRLV